MQHFRTPVTNAMILDRQVCNSIVATHTLRWNERRVSLVAEWDWAEWEGANSRFTEGVGAEILLERGVTWDFEERCQLEVNVWRGAWSLMLYQVQFVIWVVIATADEGVSPTIWEIVYDFLWLGRAGCRFPNCKPQYTIWPILRTGNRNMCFWLWPFLTKEKISSV
jgi:hypothetical protein